MLYDFSMLLQITLLALAYIIPTMPYAYFWHMVFFKEKYERWQYFGGDASVPLGFTSMIIQGIVLAFAFAMLPIDHSSIANSMLFAGVLGVFFWSTHVVAAMAKHGATRTMGYLALETVYLVGQFAMFGLLQHLVYVF